MMSKQYFICCEECLEDIGRKSTKAARLWLDLCALRLKKGEVITFPLDNLAEIRALELLGFILTTEDQSWLKVKIRGLHLTDEGDDFFCLQDGIHE
jgi:hypothetical protein